jgi:myb proto-oncogene protein
MNSESSAKTARRKWNADEDEILLTMVRVHGRHAWTKIATSLPNRTGKQCRERWTNKWAQPNNTEPWTPEEDAILIRLHRENGNAWAQFQEYLPSRTRVSIKNRWVSLTRRDAGRPIPTPQPEQPPMTILTECDAQDEESAACPFLFDEVDTS